MNKWWLSSHRRCLDTLPINSRTDKIRQTRSMLCALVSRRDIQLGYIVISGNCAYEADFKLNLQYPHKVLLEYKRATYTPIVIWSQFIVHHSVTEISSAHRPRLWTLLNTSKEVWVYGHMGDFSTNSAWVQVACHCGLDGRLLLCLQRSRWAKYKMVLSLLVVVQFCFNTWDIAGSG